MAAPMRMTTFSVSRYCRQLLRAGVAAPVSTTRSAITSSTDKDSQTRHWQEPQVGVSVKSDTIVCFHPEPDFPYENTLPLPRSEAELGEADSALKVQHVRADNLRFRPDGPTDNELANIFHTTKHQWYPNTGDKYRKPNPPKDRDTI